MSYSVITTEGWYLLSTETSLTCNEALIYFGLPSTDYIHPYIYELSGVPITEGTTLTNSHWKSINVSENSTLLPYKGYWIKVTSLPDTDTTAPSVVSFTISDTTLIAGKSYEVTLVFSEAVTDFSSNEDITTQNGTLYATSFNGVTWKGLFTPANNIEDSTNILTLNSTYTDIAGNTGPSNTTSNYAVDTVEPTVTSFVMDDTELIVGETSTVTITFSETVTGFSASDISCDNGTIDELYFYGTEWSGIFTPSENIEDTTNVLTINNYTDSAGNSGLSNTTENYEIDTKPPTLAEVTAIGNTTDTTPSYVFSSDEAGTISSSLTFTTTTAALDGNNTITFDTLSEDTYTGNTITVTTSNGNSTTLTITEFNIWPSEAVLTEVTAIGTTTDTTPSYVFSSDTVGTISSSLTFTSTTSAVSGNNTITFGTLSEDTYTGETITLTDSYSRTTTLTITEFYILPSEAVLTEVTPIGTTTSTTPSYVFSSDTVGTISSSLTFTSTTSAVSGNNTITFGTLSEDTYTGETITLTDSYSRTTTLTITDFTIENESNVEFLDPYANSSTGYIDTSQWPSSFDAEIVSFAHNSNNCQSDGSTLQDDGDNTDDKSAADIIGSGMSINRVRFIYYDTESNLASDANVTAGTGLWNSGTYKIESADSADDVYQTSGYNIRTLSAANGHDTESNTTPYETVLIDGANCRSSIGNLTMSEWQDTSVHPASPDYNNGTSSYPSSSSNDDGAGNIQGFGTQWPSSSANGSTVGIGTDQSGIKKLYIKNVVLLMGVNSAIGHISNVEELYFDGMQHIFTRYTYMLTKITKLVLPRPLYKGYLMFLKRTFESNYFLKDVEIWVNENHFLKNNWGNAGPRTDTFKNCKNIKTATLYYPDTLSTSEALTCRTYFGNTYNSNGDYTNGSYTNGGLFKDSGANHITFYYYTYTP